MTSNGDNSVVVNTTSGRVRGQTIHVLDTSVDQFLNIPFAEPPVGALRFAKPVPIQKPFDGIMDGTKMGNACPQRASQYSSNTYVEDEDCLVLNIWTPNMGNNSSSKQTSLKPVMFWIYGGGLATGSISKFNGGPLATHDIVFVAANYRLGPLGFLYGGREDAPGNQGFYDQLLALKWVRDNIHAFGGDRDEITIFGGSAGSWSISAHILSPLSKGLFKRAIMQSGAHLYNKDRDVITKSEALAQAKGLAKQLKCSESEDWLEFLRKVDAKELVKYANPTNFPLVGTEYLPLPTQQALQDKLYYSDIDLMAGCLSNEGSVLSRGILPAKDDLTLDDFKTSVNIVNQIFKDIDVQKVVNYYVKNGDTSSSLALRRGFYDFFGDIIMKMPTFLFAKQFATNGRNNGKNVYFYELTFQSKSFAEMYKCNDEISGIGHGMEIPFVFGVPFIPGQQMPFTDTERQFSRDVMKMWTNFAKYGTPDPNWPQLLSDENVPKVKNLNPNPSVQVFDDPYATIYNEFWKDYYL
ncbi:unnamed protein product [Oppiella nova]|uniref:Carboxylic ester hydrolase n=1 Tax=Oppiella nova TaxID=334625 RepID=A0A7R9MB12_9ACAR|nr:unnamed protein product [Oppiella nova]CAG2172985.1 unnamed protein product [Oppiella nova]